MDTDQWPYRGVTIEGSARLEPEPVTGDPIEDISIAYLGEDKGTPLGRSLAMINAEHTMLALDPETWHSFDYS